MAATTPTLTGPATTTGYGQVKMTGTAAPGAAVRLIEAAYIYRGDMEVAEDFANGDVITTTADGAGRFTLIRTMDSGFVFAAEAEGLRSNVITIDMIAKPTMTVTTSGTTVTVNVSADPGQPWLPVAVQRQEGSAWTTLVEGFTAESGIYSTVVTGQAAGSTQRYRAAVGPDALNGVRLGYTATVGIVIGGSGTPTTTQPTTTPPTSRPATTPPTTRPPTTPPTSRPVTTAPTTRPPTTPAPSPTTTTPPPAPAGPKAGDVQFSLVQYDPAGTDKKTNAGYNQEYVRITNYTSRTINLKFWTVQDRAGNTYRFSEDFHLRAKKNVYVLTGKGTDGTPASYRYWGKKGYVWNNTGDAAYLRTGSGKLIDSCSWGDGSGRTSC
jgi:hypothetical protein